MANELLVMPRRFDQPVIGDKMMVQGTHVRTGTDNRVDLGNSDAYTVTKGVEYLQLWATAAMWVRVSSAGSNAEAGKDQYLAANTGIEIHSIYDSANSVYRRIQEGDQVKCVTA